MFLDLAADFIDLDKYEPPGWPVLFLGSCRTNPEVLRLLINRGANPLMRDLSNNRTCLHYAIQELGSAWIRFNEANYKTYLKILLEAGLRITDEDVHGLTPLKMARTLCFTRRMILEEALTECGIEFDSLIDGGEECPGHVCYDMEPYCFCDPNWKRKRFSYDGVWRRCTYSPAFTSSHEDASDQSEDESNLDDSPEASDEVIEDGVGRTFVCSYG